MRYAQAPPVEALNNLLYYVAQSTDAGPRIAEVRQSFALHDMVATQDTAATESADTLSAPSVRLMRTVAAAIREDLTRVKDVLDIFVRKGATQVDDLAPQLDMLRNMHGEMGRASYEDNFRYIALRSMHVMSSRRFSDFGDHRIVDLADVWTIEEPDGFLSYIAVQRSDGSRELVTIKRVGLRRLH